MLLERLPFGEIVLLKFPYTNTFKKRPALVIRDFDDGDILVKRICYFRCNLNGLFVFLATIKIKKMEKEYIPAPKKFVETNRVKLIKFRAMMKVLREKAAAAKEIKE